MSGEDAFEAEELERAAAWRTRKFDADPSDVVSRDAAALLEKLARDVRALRGAAVFREYVAICNWLGESGWHRRSHGYGEGLSGADRGGSNACRWGGVYTRADRAGEADVWGGVGRDGSTRAAPSPFPPPARGGGEQRKAAPFPTPSATRVGRSPGPTRPW